MKKKRQEKKTHQPHDHLVKRLLSNPAAARDILSLYLPKEILKIVDLNQLELQRDSFIDDEHRAFAVDLLYKTSIQNQDSYIWLLIEHQRTSNPWMPVRLFKYIAIIWDHLRKIAKTNKIPLVYPFVIYNGDQPYSHSLTLVDMIEPDAAKQLFANLFVKPFSLLDLSAIQDEELRQETQNRVKGIALLMALKHSFDRDLQTFFEQIFVNVLKQLDQTGGNDEVVDIIYYLLREGKFLDTRQFLDALHGAISSETEAKIMTIAQQLEKKGIEIGFQQGIHEGIRKTMMALRMLAEGDDMPSIANASGLTIEEIESLKQTQ
jgi:recombination-promoting nuclease RpnB